MSPKGAMNCIFVKNLVDHIWEFRRMKKMKHVAINFVMPTAAAPLLAPTEGLCGNPDREKVLWQAADATCGIASEVEEGEMDFTERMASMSVSPEMIHHKALNSVADRLTWINRECERIEDRIHRLLRDYEARNATLTAMARSLVEREKVQDVAFREVN